MADTKQAPIRLVGNSDLDLPVAALTELGFELATASPDRRGRELTRNEGLHRASPSSRRLTWIAGRHGCTSSPSLWTKPSLSRSRRARASATAPGRDRGFSRTPLA